MNAGRHAAGDASFARSAGGAMTRGIVLIVVAVLIGIVLIRTAVDDSANIAAAGPADTAAAVTTSAPAESPDTTAATADTTETTAGGAAAPTTVATEDATIATEDTTTTSEGGGLIFEARDNNLVSVQVANTTSTGGAAGRQTDAFKEEGYTVKKATNWTDGVLSKTKIHHVDGSLPEARQVALFLGLDPNEDVFFMPANPEAKIGEFQEPDILVLLGSDLAT